MIVFIIGWLGFFSGLVATYLALNLYLRTRNMSNRLLAIASKEFYETIEKLVDASDELPDEIFEILETMNRLAGSDKGHKILLQALQLKREHPEFQSKPQLDFDVALGSMREELQDIFHKTVASWLNVMTHRNVFTMLQIGHAALRMKSFSNEVQSEQTSKLSILRGMGGHLC